MWFMNIRPQERILMLDLEFLCVQVGEYVSVFVDNATGSAISVLQDSLFSGILLGVWTHQCPQVVSISLVPRPQQRFDISPLSLNPQKCHRVTPAHHHLCWSFIHSGGTVLSKWHFAIACSLKLSPSLPLRTWVLYQGLLSGSIWLLEVQTADLSQYSRTQPDPIRPNIVWTWPHFHTSALSYEECHDPVSPQVN